MKEHVSIQCLTLWQPWATGIAKGNKTIETRSSSFPFHPCGRLGIHAGKTWDRFFAAGELQTPQAYKCFPIDMIREAYKVKGALLAIVPWAGMRTYQNVVDWDLDFEKHRCPHEFFELGKRGLVLGEPRLIVPIPMRGYQGLWRYEGEVEYVEMPA